MAGRLSGKVAVAAGAGRGIGAAVASAFVSEGASVFIAELDPLTGADSAAKLRARGGRVASGVCDVSDRGSVEAAIGPQNENSGPQTSS